VSCRLAAVGRKVTLFGLLDISATFRQPRHISTNSLRFGLTEDVIKWIYSLVASNRQCRCLLVLCLLVQYVVLVHHSTGTQCRPSRNVHWFTSVSHLQPLICQWSSRTSTARCVMSDESAPKHQSCGGSRQQTQKADVIDMSSNWCRSNDRQLGSVINRLSQIQQAGQTMLVHAFLSSPSHYCNSLLWATPIIYCQGAGSTN